MATDAYRLWVARGRPWSLATPIATLQTWARAAGVEIKGTIGRDDASHLQAAVPQDHTPFPAKPWPQPLPGYIVCAIDTANGPWAPRLLAAARHGNAPYVKYLNYGRKHYDIRDGWKPTVSDDEHLHVSIRSDYLGHIPTFNPFEENPAMATADEVIQHEIRPWLLDLIHASRAHADVTGRVIGTVESTQAQIDKLRADVTAFRLAFTAFAELFTHGNGVDFNTAAVIARMEDLAKMDLTRDEQHRATLTELHTAIAERDAREAKLRAELADALKRAGEI